MLESFGARLRQRREAQDIALIAVANQTKIKVSLLEALERDQVAHWPSGFYRRAFIRAYAHAIGLNPDDAVREFQEAFPEQPELIPTPSVPPMWPEEPLTEGGAPTRLRYLVGSAIDRLRRGRAADERLVFSEAPRLVAVPAGPRRVIPSGDLVPVEITSEVAADPVAVAMEDASAADGDESTPAEEFVPAAADCAPIVTESPAPDDSGDLQPNLLAVADLCTEFGRVDSPDQTQRLLAEAARLLNAVGLIVWVWDGPAAELRPALASGYSDKVLAQLPTVKREADNPTAAAFRAERTFEINGHGETRGALVIPLLSPAGCGGVLALELRPGSDRAAEFSRAAATIFAALLAQLVGGAPPADIEHSTFVAAARSG